MEGEENQRKESLALSIEGLHLDNDGEPFIDYALNPRHAKPIEEEFKEGDDFKI
jgi:hypothetical protein